MTDFETEAVPCNRPDGAAICNFPCALPEIALGRIRDFLTLRDLTNLARVSTGLRASVEQGLWELTAGYESCRFSSQISAPFDVRMPVMTKLVTEKRCAFPFLHTLNLEGWDPDEEQPIPAKLFAALADRKRFPNLVQLGITSSGRCEGWEFPNENGDGYSEGPPDADTKAAATAVFHGIRSLRIHLYLGGPVPGAPSLAARFPRLTRLWLLKTWRNPVGFGGWLRGGHPTLEELNLSVTGLVPADMSLISKAGFPRLRALSISRNGPLTAGSTSHEADTLARLAHPGLERLDVSELKLPPRALLALGPCLPSLVVLDASESPTLGDGRLAQEVFGAVGRGAETVAGLFPHVEELHLEQCRLDTASDIRAVLAAFPALRRLFAQRGDEAALSKTSDVGRGLISGHPLLEVVHVRGHPYRDPAGFAAAIVGDGVGLSVDPHTAFPSLRTFDVATEMEPKHRNETQIACHAPLSVLRRWGYENRMLLK